MSVSATVGARTGGRVFGDTSMRALLGVSDRTGISEFARALQECGVELIATDGTKAALATEGIDAMSVADLTGLPEMLDGRVKTLHPAVFAGILARRDRPDHMNAIAEHGFAGIDIVVVNLYPFAATVASGADRAAIVEKIDIGGPSLIRAAAKNAASVAVLVMPEQYPAVADELRASGGVSEATRKRLAAEAFAHVAEYDTDIAAYFRDEAPPEWVPPALTTGGRRIAELRYGENPHQRGALYGVPGRPGGVAHGRLMQGTSLSFTNWLDVDAAYRIVNDFDEPAAAIIKHTNPCGFAVGESIDVAYRRAFECDPRSAFGGVVAVNRPIDGPLLDALGTTFLEVIVAPAVEASAAERLRTRERVRVLVVDGPLATSEPDVRSIAGGLLVQTVDHVNTDRSAINVVTVRQPTDDQWDDLLIAWQLCRHVKSNAIVVVRDGRAIGVGAGQMSRVEAAELAVRRSGDQAPGAVAASDAFFPMPDGLETLAQAGVVAIIQPGGSKKDGEVTAAADRLGVAMIHAGERHFRH